MIFSEDCGSCGSDALLAMILSMKSLRECDSHVFSDDCGNDDIDDDGANCLKVKDQWTNAHCWRFGKRTYHFSEDDDINNIVDFFLTQDRRIFSTKSFLGRDSCTMELHLQMGQSVLDDPHPRCLLPSIFSLPLYSLPQVFPSSWLPS